jgi:spore photoproduct lyase
MIAYRPERVVVQESSWDDAATRKILDRLPGVPVATARDLDGVVEDLRRSSDPIASGKRTLMLARHRGRFMKDCPGAGAEVCCNYHVVNLASNCHLECTYCFLQAYLNNPAVVIFTNLDEALSEIETSARRAPERAFRIGTGEIADSLALDELTCYSRRLVPFFGALPNAVLELKTKSDCVGNLEGLDHRGHTIVSWSMNSRAIVETEELKTASFDRRAAAARSCQRWGYRVGIHFDPLVHYPGWERGYEEAVRDLFRAVDPSGVAWVSLGALRFTPGLRDIVRERFPRSRIPRGEIVPGNHGKLRYFRPIREEMYERMRDWLGHYAPGVFTFLCMENRAAWGEAPPTTAELSGRMDRLVQL